MSVSSVHRTAMTQQTGHWWSGVGPMDVSQAQPFLPPTTGPIARDGTSVHHLIDGILMWPCSVVTVARLEHGRPTTGESGWTPSICLATVAWTTFVVQMSRMVLMSLRTLISRLMLSFCVESVKRAVRTLSTKPPR